MFWEKLSPFCFSRLAYRGKWIWGPCRPIFLESPDKYMLESHKKIEKLQFFWIHAFSLNFSSWHAECWSDNPSGTFWHVRSCSARSLGIAKAWWPFHICFLSKVPRTVRMQFRQTCWKVLQIIWKIFHTSSEKFEKILDLSNQSLISLKTFLVTQKAADLPFLPKIFRQKHDNFLGRSPAKKNTMLKFYTPFSDILLKIIKLSKTSQKNKYQNTVLLKMFSMTVRTHFWYHSGMSLPNLVRNFVQLPEKVVCFSLW